MKKGWALLLSFLLSIQLCGCSNLAVDTTKMQEESVELTLAIPKGSSSILMEVAQELARRTEDFADNSITVNIEEKSNIWDVAEKGEADLLICENSMLLASAEDAGELRYFVKSEQENDAIEYQTINHIGGSAAMMAMLEYPYFFRDSECVLGGGNDAEILAALNHSFSKDMKMELKRISYCGFYHWLTGDGKALGEYTFDKTESEILNAQLAIMSIRDPFGYLGESQQYVREIDLTENKTDLTDKTLLLSSARYRLLDIFILPKSMEKLSENQKAAIEEAIVYSGGYSRTLADDQQKMILEQLKAVGVNIVNVAVDPWYDAFQSLYLSGNYEVNSELVDLLADKTQCYH